MKTKYMTIYEDLKQKIAQGEYEAGDQLPDEKTLCQVYGCSRMTVKKALDMLVEEGMLYRRQGQGSFVLGKMQSDDTIEIAERDLSGFTKSANGKGSTKVLHFGLIFATREIAENLDLKENDPVYDILRVRNYDGKPFVIEHTYMSPNVVPGVTEDVLNHSVYAYIEDDLGKRIASAHKVSWADCSNKQDQKELGLKPNEPVLVVEQVAYLDNGVPFEYSISRHRYDKFRFSIYSLRR